MRDLMMLAVFPIFLFFIFRRPFIGAGLWIWTALFFPNGWLYGAAAGIRYNLWFSTLTIFSFFLTQKTKKYDGSLILILILCFWGWTTVTTFFGSAPTEISWDIWTRFSKVVLLSIFIVLIVCNKLEIEFILWCLVFSVGFYGCLEGLKFIASGGGHRITGFRGHVLGDRNELAIAFVMILPIYFYLVEQYGKTSLALKYALMMAAFLIIIAVIGTLSRGGLISLLSVITYFFLKSEKKVLFALIVIVVSIAVSTLIPPEWFERMDTIGEAGNDASFMGRVVAWKMSFIMAIQNPLFGGGFKALETYSVWQTLSQSFDSYSWFYTGTAVPDQHAARAAHSIYFQVLGDHGFVGLSLFLAILSSSYLKANNIVKRSRKSSSLLWAGQLAVMLRLSIVAYSVGGAALSFAYFDLIYALCALVVVLERQQIKLNNNDEYKQQYC